MRKRTCLLLKIQTLSLLLLCLLSAAPAIAFTGDGAGTSGDPYLITNTSQLQEMADDLYAHYKLANDIDATETVTWNGAHGFMPVGNEDTPFHGYLDGANHAITGLHINRSTDYIGLFGMMQDPAEVKDLRLVNCSVTGIRFSDIGAQYVGILAGKTYLVIVSNCHASGTVKGQIEVGILIGQSIGIIEYSSTAGNVTGNVAVGGLAGSNAYMIDYCYSTAEVYGDSAAGGLIGANAPGIVTNCYAKGAVTGDDNVGGFIGSDDQGDVTNCYSAGLVTGTTPSTTGGFLGSEASSADYTDCFWDTTSSNQTTSAYGTGLPIGLMMLQASFTNWDFLGNSGDGTDDIWKICQTTNYPKLVWQLLPGDFVCPDGVDFEDLLVLIDQWLESPSFADIAPASAPDGIVSFPDFALFAQNWLTGLEP